MRYVDVILPLPLEGLFTYGVSPELVSKVQSGVRVVVPFNKSKRYTAIAVRLHDEKPDFEVKSVIEVLDERPLLLPAQLKLWQWISDYYMAPLGDVMNAALPAGLKNEEGYRPKTETYIGLCKPYQSERSLHIALDMLSRAEKQQKVLTTFLDISGWSEAFGNDSYSLNEKERLNTQFSDTQNVGESDGKGYVAPIAEITREELINESHCTAAVLKSLIDRKVLYTYEREVGRLNLIGVPHPEYIKPLSQPQQDAYNQVLFQFLRKQVVLLHGVTSSGKTEIYIHLIQKTLDEGKQVLYLLPEIALTVQMMERLRRVFGNRLGIYHSRYSDAERVEIWQKQLSGNPYDVILGARSAVFLPMQRLGLVIVDEEHETSFKQQDPAPRYHARSVAIMMGAKVLLGTATPSMETYYNAQQGKFGLVTLSTRYQGIEMPEIQIVDVKDLRRRKMMSGPFSPQLLAAIRKALDEEKQVILFQNRRGFAPMIECKTCGWVPHCKNCDVSLTLHKNTNVLTCHYCGYTYAIPTHCPSCEGTDLRGRGYGTEKIEDQIREIFPEARVARMDLDTTRSRNAYERLIGEFASGRTNVLIGTQMISKGLDFDRVAVVGILDADTMLNYPDFRAYEHAFMMMAQVAGRAGRKGKRGLVLLQTKNKDLPVVRQVVKNDWQGFYEDLLSERRMFNYPPFHHLIYIYMRHKYEHVVESAAIYMGGLLRQWFGERVLGPDKPGVSKVKTMHIRKIVLKLENGIQMQLVREYLKRAHQQILQDKQYAALQIFFDVDPL
ncbi:MAG: primosomal protein N' [Prevotella sp.]|nr:primosomal protein N' [Prevotella sp.]